MIPFRVSIACVLIFLMPAAGDEEGVHVLFFRETLSWIDAVEAAAREGDRDREDRVAWLKTQLERLRETRRSLSFRGLPAPCAGGVETVFDGGKLTILLDELEHLGTPGVHRVNFPDDPREQEIPYDRGVRLRYESAVCSRVVQGAIESLGAFARADGGTLLDDRDRFVEVDTDLREMLDRPVDWAGWLAASESWWEGTVALAGAAARYRSPAATPDWAEMADTIDEGVEGMRQAWGGSHRARAGEAGIDSQEARHVPFARDWFDAHPTLPPIEAALGIVDATRDRIDRRIAVRRRELIPEARDLVDRFEAFVASRVFDPEALSSLRARVDALRTAEGDRLLDRVPHRLGRVAIALDALVRSGEGMDADLRARRLAGIREALAEARADLDRLTSDR